MLYFIFKKSKCNEFNLTLIVLRHDRVFASDRLFELLDLDHNGQLDLKEFVGGLSLLCKVRSARCADAMRRCADALTGAQGTVEEKLELSFALYDRDGNGAIDRRELALMFEHAWLAGVKALRAEHASADDDEMRELSDEELAQFAKKMVIMFVVCCDFLFESCLKIV